MHKDSSARSKPILNEFVGSGKMLEKVLVFDVVDFNNVMLKAFEQCLLERQTKHGEDMRDAGFLQRRSSTEREKSESGSERFTHTYLVAY